MPRVRYEGQDCEVQPGQSVLDALLAGGVAVKHGCRSGNCGSCMVRAVEGEVPVRAQAGLKDSWKSRGYFLACVCHPLDDLTVAGAGDDTRVRARIASLRRLSASVLEVNLACDSPFSYNPGQHVMLVRDANLYRSYSLASLPEDGAVALHVRRIPNGAMSGWLFDAARPGTPVDLQGPSGDCFYVPGREDQPLLLAGTGTGLAPLYGILRDAMARGHRGPIHLFHGALKPSGLYLREELRAMAATYGNFHYTPAVLDGDGDREVETGAIDKVILRLYPNLEGWRAFVCGDPGLVQMLRKKLFLSGVASRDIYADAFVPNAA